MKPVIAVVIVLSLLIWGLFYFYGLPLTAAETTVVVGICFLIALVMRKLFHLVRPGSATNKGAKG